ncbi:MAG: hypothetical protein H0X33_10000 [Taibaiella sp.]|nr:hypothetical protein [Taibaiella sp.]
MSKPASANFIVPLVIYPYDVMVSVAETDEQLRTRLKRYGLDKEDNLWMYSSANKTGKAVAFPGDQCLIRIKSLPKTPFDFGNLLHEIFHVASFIMWKIGMKLKIKNNDEAYAYLIGYLTKVIYEKLL